MGLPIMRLSVPLLALLIAGCAPEGTPRLTGVDRAGPPAALLPVTFDPGAGRETRLLAEALAAALNSRAVPATSPDGPALTIAVSRAPASIGLAVEGKAAGPVDWLSLPRRERPFDACRVERLHASVTGPGIAVHGETDFCRLDQDRIDALAQSLARAVRGN